MTRAAAATRNPRNNRCNAASLPSQKRCMSYTSRRCISLGSSGEGPSGREARRAPFLLVERSYRGVEREALQCSVVSDGNILPDEGDGARSPAGTRAHSLDCLYWTALLKTFRKRSAPEIVYIATKELSFATSRPGFGPFSFQREVAPHSPGIRSLECVASAGCLPHGESDVQPAHDQARLACSRRSRGVLCCRPRPGVRLRANARNRNLGAASRSGV